MANSTFADLTPAVFGDLDETDTLFASGQADEGGSLSVTLGLLRSVLFAGVANVIAYGVDAVGVDQVATTVFVRAPLSTGAAQPAGWGVQVGMSGASGAASQALTNAIAITAGVENIFFAFGSIETTDEDVFTFVNFGSANVAPTEIRNTLFRVNAPSSVGFRGVASLELALGGEDELWTLALGAAPAGVAATFDDLQIAGTAGVPVFALSQAGALQVLASYGVNGTKVVGAQGAVVADAAGGVVIDAEARTALNALLARARAHGLIAT